MLRGPSARDRPKSVSLSVTDPFGRIERRVLAGLTSLHREGNKGKEMSGQVNSFKKKKIMIPMDDVE